MKKALSLVITLSMLLLVFSVIPAGTIQHASAADYVASVDFSNGATSGNNISLVVADYVDAITQAATKGGTQCRYIPANNYAYFRVDDAAVPTSQRNLFIEVTYYDEGSSGLTVHYNAVSGDYAGAEIARTNSGKWLTTTICLTNAAFNNKQNNAADMRISGTAYIKSVKISFGSIDLNNTDLGKRTGGSSYSEFKGKSVAGYQAWFGTGGKNDNWSHWGSGKVDSSDGSSWPKKNNHSIDIYPTVDEYPDSALAQTGFANLGDGSASKLFDSKDQAVIDTHFKWMKEYGIDGAAVQRFSTVITGKTISGNPENHLYGKIKSAAEKYDRIFYVMYDISGGLADTYIDDMKFDWIYNVEHGCELLNSDSYATVNGKPVVCIWGLGVEERPTNGYNDIVNFFKSRGCYVILGVNDNWRTQNNYIEVFKQADMISPWYVGRFGDSAGVDSFYSNNTQPDINFCKNNGLDYYPVIFSGFSWATWQNGKPNMTPRNAGNFLWYQAYKLKQMGLDSVYFAMFDEYDEGTAIMKNASDYFEIPTDQYFVTASADGYWLSNDFQLRTSGNIVKMMKGQITATQNNTTAHSQGPIYYRNSFESRYVDCVDTKYNGIYPVDPCFKNPTQLSASGTSADSCNIVTEQAKTGSYSAKLGGSSAAGGSSYFYKFADCDITVKSGMELTFDKYAANDQGKYTSVDLLFSDGTKLSDSLTDYYAANGTVGAWTNKTVRVGTGANVGKKVVGLILGYKGSASGNYTAYFDNVIVQDGTADPCDLYASSVKPVNTSLADGTKTAFSCTVRNMGDAPSSGSFNVEFYRSGQLIETVRVDDSVAAGKFAVVTTSSEYAVPFGVQTIKVMINYDQSVPETDMTNNIVKMRFRVSD